MLLLMLLFPLFRLHLPRRLQPPTILMMVHHRVYWSARFRLRPLEVQLLALAFRVVASLWQLPLPLRLSMLPKAR